MLKTAVYQSYRTENVPCWISKCMETVKDWASLKGYDYHFIDDRMFSYAPDWYREKVKNNVLLVSDLARLEIAKELLASGYDRTIWVDADIVIFDLDNFNIDIEEEFAFTREIWVKHTNFFGFEYIPAVCNAVTVMLKENSILDFYIYACKKLISDPDWAKKYVYNNYKLKMKLKHRWDLWRYNIGSDFIPSTLVGTTFLTNLYNQMAFHLLNNVGLFSPLMMHELTKDYSKVVAQYMKTWNTPIYSANLCGSYWNKKNDAVYMSVVERLLESKGDIINKYHNASQVGNF